MSKLGKKNSELEKFKSNIADVIGESLEKFDKETQTRYEYHFQSQRSLENAMKKMGMDHSQEFTVSLDEHIVNNVGDTLNAHGDLAKEYSKNNRVSNDELTRFSDRAGKMSTLIKDLPNELLQTKDKEVELVSTIGTGTKRIYLPLEESTKITDHISVLKKLGEDLLEYVESLFDSPKKQQKALLRSTKETVKALNDVPESSVLKESKSKLKEILAGISPDQANRIKNALSEVYSNTTTSPNVSCNPKKLDKTREGKIIR